MPNARVLVVDDAVVVRRIVTDLLQQEPDLEVVGTAPNGRIALQKITQLNPDLVTLDVEMPVLDGLATLKQLRVTHPNLPVIMFSTLTERGASVTMEALMNGANEYVTKPANVGSVTEAMARIREELVPKIHTLTGRSDRPRPGAAARTAAPTSRPTARPAPQPAPSPRRRSAATVDCVVIGVSTGGPNALAEVVPALPGDLRVPVLIVQHMPAMFTRLLAERLDSHAPLNVRESAGREPVRAGDVLVAPGGRHLEVRASGGGAVTHLTDAPMENSCRPSVDVLFRTAASVYGDGVLAVVLTGMGADGRRGCEHVRETGGAVLAQDRPTSVVWGMPGAVVEAGLVDEVVPLGEVAARIAARVGAPTATRRTEVAR